MNKRYARFTLAASIAIAAFWSSGVRANGIGMGSLENQIYSFGGYSSLVGMGRQVQQKLIDDHFLFVEGDLFLKQYMPNMVVSE